MAGREAALEEQAEQAQEGAETELAPAEEEAGPGADLTERQEHFFAVAGAMRMALDESPDFDIEEDLTLAEQDAIEKVFEANAAVDDDLGAGHISAIKRGQLLDQALVTLQPVLALGRTADFPEGRTAYLEIEERIAELRSRISAQGWVEAVVFTPAAAERAPDDEDEGEGDAEEGEER